MGTATNESQVSTASGHTGPRGVYIDLGLSRLGLSRADPLVADWWDDFNQEQGATQLTGWSVGVTSTATITNQAAGMGAGVVQLSVGATGSSVANAIGIAGSVSRVDTTKWYVATRFRITTAADATLRALVGLSNFAGNKTVMIGWQGALNPNNFIVQFDGNFAGSSVDLGVAKDTVFHIFELYSLGDGKVRGRIDGGAEVNATMAAAPADSLYHYMICSNSANQVMQVDYILSLAQRI